MTGRFIKRSKFLQVPVAPLLLVPAFQLLSKMRRMTAEHPNPHWDASRFLFILFFINLFTQFICDLVNTLIILVYLNSTSVFMVTSR
jgi:hypothetical protein